MFRTAILRSAAAVARPVASRSFSVVSRPAAAAQVAKSFAPSRVASWTAVRCYASAGGLSKEDVQGRIMSVLAGFDKVRCFGEHESPGRSILVAR